MEQVEIFEINDLIEKIMLGFAVILIDGSAKGIAFGVQGYKSRGVQEPDNEAMIRGSKEGFVEAVQVNVSMMRRRLRTTDLKFERMSIGSESKTPVVISYLENRVSKKILGRIKLELENIDIKTVMAAGYLTGFLNKGGIFATINTSERPDTVCAKLEEGRVAVIVDGTPSVLIMPFLFVENFQCMDDYATKPSYGTYIRYIKYLCFFFSAYLPGLYVGIITGRPELIPDQILVNIAIEEMNTPFNVFWEIFFVNLLYEIMREAGLRAPKVFSQAVSIVGALVVGDMAVSAGLIGTPSLIIIALAAISGYAIPRLYEQLALIRFSVIIISGLFGVWGLLLSFMFVLFNICSEMSFDVPITAPVSPFSLRAMRDVLVRASWRVLRKERSKVQDMSNN